MAVLYDEQLKGPWYASVPHAQNMTIKTLLLTEGRITWTLLKLRLYHSKLYIYPLP